MAVHRELTLFAFLLGWQCGIQAPVAHGPGPSPIVGHPGTIDGRDVLFAEFVLLSHSAFVIQMSYRLDQGEGNCLYRLGVEDNGCHSLLDYESVAESARILECIARSLNAVVVERRMIQNEIVVTEDGEPRKCDGDVKPLIVVEPSVWGAAQQKKLQQQQAAHDGEPSKEEKEPEIENDELRLQKVGPHNYTRAEVQIHRVETHLLDPSPLSLVELAKSAEHMQAHQIPSSNGHHDNHHDGATTTPTCGHGTKMPAENLSVGETLSSRNIRIAVVGNVDAGTFYAKSTLLKLLVFFLLSCADKHHLHDTRQVDLDRDFDHVQLGRWPRQEPHSDHEASPRN
jgi:hypothetical protein